MTDFTFTQDEITQFRYILPVQGSLSNLELVEKIFEKLSVGSEDDVNISFEDKEISLIRTSIHYLDSQQKLHLAMLPLIRKILQGEK